MRKYTFVFLGIICISFALLESWQGGIFAEQGQVSQIKPNGVSVMIANNSIGVFEGHTTEACPANPTLAPQHNSLPALTANENICYTCTPNNQDNVCDSYHQETYCASYGTGGCESYGSTTVCDHSLHTHYGRTCVLKEPPYNYIIDGGLFKPGAWGYAKNSQCGEGTSIPNANLIVTETSQKTYMYDEVNPTCIRGGFASYASFGSGWIEDNAIRDIVANNIGSIDTTLTYTEPLGTLETTRIYSGEWTYKDVQAKGVCSDAESGCNLASSTPVYSGPLGLWNKQLTFVHSPGFKDNANNATKPVVCPTSTSKMTGISRKCTFIIDPIKISNVINANPGWFNSLPNTDSTFLSGLTMSQTSSANAAAYARRLRSLSNSGANSLSAYLNIVPAQHDLLYTFVNNSCMYSLTFNNGIIIPLVDRIMPTVEVTAQIGSGIFTIPNDTLLLKQEGTFVPGMALVDNSGSTYIAGSGNITITLVDPGSSTFTSEFIWKNYNGISGIRAYTIDICRTKTHTGLTLEPINCSTSSQHKIYSTAKIVDPPYNSTGAIIDPHTIIISQDFTDDTPDGIQVTGEYEVHIELLDRAGNMKTSAVRFNIIPQGLDPSKTALNKYDHPSVENPSTTVYNITGSSAAIMGLSNISEHANAMDIQTYKLSFFDIYANPIYGWNLYGFALTQTGIYLDQVDKIGPSSLFIYASGGILSNSGQTGTTNGDGALKFDILSYTPGEFLEQFEFRYKNFDRYRNEVGPYQSYTFPHQISKSQTGSFLHILTGAIDLYTTNRIDLGTSNDIQLDFFTTSARENTTLTGFSVSNFLESIITLYSDNFIITNTGDLIPGTTSSYNPGINFGTYYPDPTFLTGATGSFIPEQKGTLFPERLSIETFPYITLSFSGLTTRYYVSNLADTYGSGISYNTGILNRIYVEGLTSIVGKNGYVTTKDSIRVNSAETRNEIHKNVSLLLRNRTSTAGGSIVNRIKYVTGNINSTSLADMDDWDVLIINGGNLTIGNTYSDDVAYEDRNYYFNSGTTSFETIAHKGIIVLKDENTGNGGNIYIRPDVRFIGVSLFADESIQSVRYNGTLFSVSNSARTFLLDKQLIIYGNIFSKNTIGGAVRADSAGKYILPWNKTTSSLDEAIRYDLSFLRMDNVGYDPNSFLHRGHNEFVVILTDPRNNSDPLPGFLKKK